MKDETRWQVLSHELESQQRTWNFKAWVYQEGGVPHLLDHVRSGPPQCIHRDDEGAF